MRARKPVAILFIGFMLGAALMGVEMAAIRMMTPYFGSAIETWACMIATVMLSMMAGYYLGGMVADRRPRSGLLGGVVLVAGLFVLAVPFFASSMLDWMLQNLGYDPLAVLTASIALMFVPMMLLSFFSPFAVRLLLSDAQHGGRVAGSVYSITTIGNVVGTLVAPLYLMRILGTRDIMLGFAAVVVVCGVALIALRMRARVDATRFLILLLALAGAGSDPAGAEEARVIPALYPEGPLWHGERLYYAEMRADRITVVDAAGPRAFFVQEGCGPTAIAPYGDGFVVLCHLGGHLVAVDAAGKELQRWHRARPGLLLGSPNDASADGKGGVYFSRPGPFGLGWAARGWIMHLSADGVLRPIAGRLDYPNGVHVAGDVLYVSEHLRGRILRYNIEAGGRLGRPRTLVDLAKIPRPARYHPAYPLTGPDGLEIGPDGNLYVAIYGEGRLLKFSPDGELLGMTELPTRYLTNVAFGKPGVAVTGVFDNAKPPFPGEVRILPTLP